MPATVRKAVFPAAGLGTRFLPATKAQPKEMLVLVDKPVIQYGVEEAVQSGADNIIIVTGRGKNAIEDHFDIAVELESYLQQRGKTELLKEIRKITDQINVSYVRQGEPLGLGHAVLCTASVVGNEPFAVLLADDLMDANPPAMCRMAELFREKGCSLIGVEEVPRDQTQSYGIVTIDKMQGDCARMHSIVEKPRPAEAPSNLGVIGRYVLTPRIFDMLSEVQPGAGGEIQLTDGISRLLEHERVLALRLPGRRFDCGSKLGYLKATVELGLRHPEVGKDFARYLKGRNA